MTNFSQMRKNMILGQFLPSSIKNNKILKIYETLEREKFLPKYHESIAYSDLNINYPIYISNTQIGTGVTSIYDANDRVVGIGTTFLDNIYNVSKLLII